MSILVLKNPGWCVRAPVFCQNLTGDLDLVGGGAWPWQNDVSFVIFGHQTWHLAYPNLSDSAGSFRETKACGFQGKSILLVSGPGEISRVESN